jgi:hypothetical protein
LGVGRTREFNRKFSLRALLRPQTRERPLFMRRFSTFALFLPALGCGFETQAPSDATHSEQPLAAGTYTFATLTTTGKCIDVSGAGSQDGTNIQQWTCNGTGAQSFRIENTGGASRIVNTPTGKCVDVAAAGKSNGTNVQLWTCNGTAAQSFVISDAGDGRITLRNPNSNRCVDVNASGKVDGTNIQIWDCNKSNAQLFRALPINTPNPDPKPNRFVDAFDVFNTSLWSCEYSCPKASQGAARFSLLAGIQPNNLGSWSKIRYKPRRFTSGKFTARFALTNRPNRAVWWGIALWDDGPSADGSKFNEINFGYTTNQSFTNTQLFFESAKLGKAASVKIDTGVNLYDGSYHTGQLEYDSKHVSFYFDGVLKHTITDVSVIPTDPMDFIIGPRLVTGSAPLTADFAEIVDSTEIEW